MNRKPWPIVILALLHIFEPFPKIFLYAHRNNLETFEFIQRFLDPANLFNTMEFFLLFPIAGLSILMVKRWSLPVFILIEAYVVFTHIRGHESIPDIVSLPLIIVFFILNVSVVSYFLLPAVRVVYLDPKLRWWESKTRYKVDINAEFVDDSGTFGTRLSDIAEGGVYVISDKSTALHMQGRISFTHLGFSVNVEGEVVYFAKPGGNEFGFKFLNLDSSTKRDIKKLIRAIKNQGAESTRPIDDWYKDFSNWAAELFTSGKGLVPNQPTRSSDNGT